MRRKNDAHKEELEGVAQRLRNERPEASPLQLDQIKTSAMSRAKAGTRRHKASARRLATAGLTIGLLAAGTGGVIAGATGGGGPHGGSSSISASSTQYGGDCNITNGSGNVGDKNGAGAENITCSEISYITENNNSTTTINNNTTTSGGTTNNNYYSTTVSATPAASSGVLASKTTKPALSLRDIKIHLNLSRKTHLKKVTLKLDGKTFKVLKGSAASKNIRLTNLPCSSGATTITVVAVTSTGKTVTESHTFHLCQA
jgi:hypothetical protein